MEVQSRYRGGAEVLSSRCCSVSAEVIVGDCAGVEEQVQGRCWCSYRSAEVQFCYRGAGAAPEMQRQCREVRRQSRVHPQKCTRGGAGQMGGAE